MAIAEVIALEAIERKKNTNFGYVNWTDKKDFYSEEIRIIMFAQ